MTRFALPLLDVVAAVVLTVATELQIWLADDLHGSRTGLAVAYAVVTVAVGMRRRAPGAAVGLTAVAGFASLPMYSGDGTDLIFGVLVATLVIAYSVAAHEDRTDLAVAGLLVLLAAYWLGDLQQGNPPAEYLGSFIGVGGAWLTGRVVAHERRQTKLLESALTEIERQRALAESAAAEAERARIVRELHDIVAHSLSVIAVQADAADIAIERSADNPRGNVAAIRATAHEALAEMRRLLGILREEPARSPAPSLADLSALRERLSAAGVAVVMRVEGDEVDLPPAIDASAFRIIQEGLTNARRHAPTARAEVIVRYTSDAVEICIENDVGQDGQPALGGGHGLVGIRERAESLGGTMNAGPWPGGTWRLDARLPLDHAS